MVRKNHLQRELRAKQPMLRKFNINIIKLKIIIEHKRRGRKKSKSIQMSHFSQQE